MASIMTKPSSGISARSASRRSVRVSAEVSAKTWINNWKAKKSDRISWFPGSPLPDHLDGTLAGDYGFDPLNLGAEPYKLKWYVQAELQNGRWAMLGVAGALGQELLGNLGVAGPAAQVEWFNAGKAEYFAPTATLNIIMFFLFHWAEVNRWQDIRNPGSNNKDPIFTNNKVANPETGYPGFDPLGLTKGDFTKLKNNEIKNGRLAMVAFAGIFTQWQTTGKSPLANLADHLADPWATTVLSNDIPRL